MLLLEKRKEKPTLAFSTKGAASSSTMEHLRFIAGPRSDKVSAARYSSALRRINISVYSMAVSFFKAQSFGSKLSAAAELFAFG